MDKEKIILVGDAGQASVIADIIEDEGRYEIIGVTSITRAAGDTFRGYPVLGDDSVLPEYQAKGYNKLALGVGGYRSNAVRRKIYERLCAQGFEMVSAIHPTVFISKTAKIGAGLIAYPGGIVLTDAVIGENVIMALSATVGHGTVVGSHALISAGVNVGADVTFGEETLAGIGAKIVSGVKVGARALIAAGSVVTREVAEDTFVTGIPAKVKEPKNA